MKDLTVAATLENLAPVQEFIESEPEAYGCPMKAMLQISVAVEEIYVNIAHYAYHPEIGKATVRCCVEEAPLRVTIQFLDNGVPFDPLKKPDADTSLPADEREIGGLGILMVKKTMDDVNYSYKDGTNILTIRKTFSDLPAPRFGTSTPYSPVFSAVSSIA